MKRVAILGATAHLAKSLLYQFAGAADRYALALFTRRPEELARFITDHAPSLTNEDCRIYEGYRNFDAIPIDVIINCVGAGTLGKHKGDYSSYFTVYETFDNLAIDYLRKRPDTTYISVGSGAVYGNGFDRPAGELSENRIKVNCVPPQDYYAIARVYSEAKHRSFSDLRIVDLRVFSFFSRFYDPADGYLVDQMVDAVRSGAALITDESDFFRDYIHPDDLFNVVKAIVDSDARLNQAFDLCSTCPVKKSELIDFFSAHYDMRVAWRKNVHASATGRKLNYFSTFRRPFPGGTTIKHSSIEAIAAEAKHLLACDIRPLSNAASNSHSE